MEDFKSLESLYQYLEENAINHPYPYEISTFFRKLRERLCDGNADNEESIRKAQWEVDCFQFKRKEGRVEPWYSIPDELGNIVKYPDLERFNQDTFTHLIARLEHTNNTLLQACYAHILWSSPRKHQKYVKIAIDSYLKLVDVYITKEQESPGSAYCSQISGAIINAYCLSAQVNHNFDAVKMKLRALIMQKIGDSRQAFVLRTRLIQWLLEGQKKFLTSDFDGLQHTCWQIATLLAQDDNLHEAIHVLALGEQIDLRLEQCSHDWKGSIAKHYETLMEQRQEEPTVALLFCQHALHAYKQTKNEQKIRELEQKFSRLKESVELTGQKFRVDIGDHIRQCQKIAQEVVQQPPEEILKMLILDTSLLPCYDDIVRVVERHDREFIADKIFPPILLDTHANIAQHFSSEEERKHYQILEHYRIALDVEKIPLIHEIFSAAIHTQKLSPDIVLSFLGQCSWFGEKFTKRYPNGRSIEYTWVSLIAPAVHEFFVQMQYYMLSPSHNRPNFMLSIDSLVLKLEGIIRHLHRLAGGSVSYTKQDKHGRHISREKDINTLLYEEKIEQLFTKDDLLFFKYLLVEQAGYNLRNEVAHSLLIFQEYTIDLMYLLMLALLKLAKYSNVGEDKEVVEDENRTKQCICQDEVHN